MERAVPPDSADHVPHRSGSGMGSGAGFIAVAGQRPGIASGTPFPGGAVEGEARAMPTLATAATKIAPALTNTYGRQGRREAGGLIRTPEPERPTRLLDPMCGADLVDPIAAFERPASFVRAWPCTSPRSRAHKENRTYERCVLRARRSPWLLVAHRGEVAQANHKITRRTRARGDSPKMPANGGCPEFRGTSVTAH